MSIITDVYAREVLDSRGNPTLEVEVYTESGVSLHQPHGWRFSHQREAFGALVISMQYLMPRTNCAACVSI